MIEIVDLDTRDSAVIEQLAILTFEAFKENMPDWVPTIDLARDKVLEASGNQKHARVLKLHDEVVGWFGLTKRQYLWEIHPIAVAIEHQYQGFGRMLVEDAARIAKDAGALTLFAGTSDEVGTTNLFGADIYSNPSDSIRNLKATRRSPFEFWEHAGFTVVGLMPDEEGVGKPGIHLARRL
jgi:aminoglycoside 6'-N-acetyltransferase I